MTGQEDFIIELTDVVDDGVPDYGMPESSGVSQEMLTVTGDQVMAAVEKVVREQFSQKIDAMMETVMEKVLLKEISEMKERLLSELEQAR